MKEQFVTEIRQYCECTGCTNECRNLDSDDPCPKFIERMVTEFGLPRCDEEPIIYKAYDASSKKPVEFLDMNTIDEMKRGDRILARLKEKEAIKLVKSSKREELLARLNLSDEEKRLLGVVR